MNLALILLTASRAWTDVQALEDALLENWHDALQDGYDGIDLMHGCADGVDTIGDTWAVQHGVPVRPRPADWEGPCAPRLPARAPPTAPRRHRLLPPGRTPPQPADGR